MQVFYKRLTDVNLVKESMCAVRGKRVKDSQLDLNIWYEMLLSPHSSVRCVLYRVYIKDIPYYAQNHLVRHKVGVEPTVYSQRSTEGRGKLPQEALIDMHLDINAQALLNMARVRMCNKADKVVREFMNLIKEELCKGDKYDMVLGKLMLPNCELYAGICPEPKCCGKLGVRRMADIHRHLISEE